MSTSSKPQVGIQSVEVGFVLLQALADARGAMMLRDLAAAAGMNAAKAHRYLVSFQRLGLVVQDAHSTRYDLGPSALKLGLACLERLDAVQLARARMGDLMLELGHTLAVAVWGNHGPTIVHWLESAHTVRVNLRLGDVMPLLTSATGRCFAAYAPPKAVQAQLQLELAMQSKLTGMAHSRAGTHAGTDVPATLPAAQRLFKDIRQRGLARVSGSLLPGVAALCAPVFDASGHMVLGLVSLGSQATFDAAWDGAVAIALQRAAQQLSGDLGARRAGGAGFVKVR